MHASASCKRSFTSTDLVAVLVLVPVNFYSPANTIHGKIAKTRIVGCTSNDSNVKKVHKRAGNDTIKTLARPKIQALSPSKPKDGTLVCVV
mmetsp:Transcript_2171/g.4119  ORF Transcript_2171/g.4119 Transcript_2171/m.4119 type:complete len:91 (+) Transcript_2171:99-371(+)